jgi:IS30 family transposase
MKYTHFLHSERAAIGCLLDLGISHNQIGKQIGRSQASVSREVKRNSVKGKYIVKIAQKTAVGRRVLANTNQKKIVSGSILEAYIVDKMTNYNWSPEQVCGRWKLDQEAINTSLVENISISHETIYNWIYTQKDLELKNKLTLNLRYNKGKYRRRHGTRQRRQECEEMKKNRIDTRPKIVETRCRLGDWEGDTIVGGEKTQHILTHVDRRSGYLMADKLDIITALETQLKTIARFRLLPEEKRCTLTYDNGVQFSLHQGTQEKLNLPIFFAYPYHSWERGTNENTNGLLRQYYPKGSLFIGITQEILDQTVELINNRPRKRLNYLTPYEVFVLELEF